MKKTDKLSEIEARREAITEGPWVWDEDGVILQSRLHPKVIARSVAAADGDFIAYAAQDIDWLVAELQAHRTLEEVVRYEHSRNFREPGRPTIKEALATFDQRVGESDGL